MKKYITIVVIITLIGLLMVAYCLTMMFPKEAVVEVLPTQEFAPAIENVLAKKIALVERLTSQGRLVEILREKNQENAALTLEEIQALDIRWREAPEDDRFVEEFLRNEPAEILSQFKKNNDVFTEIFLTDVRGLNVGQTNKTTDYYQADEDWWQGAYNHGKGLSYHGQIEYDESSQTRAIALYIAVYDTFSGDVIGIIKAVVNLEKIEQEF